MVVRLKVRSDNKVQRYHYRSAVADRDARFDTLTSDAFDQLAASPSSPSPPDLTGARSARDGFRRSVHVTETHLVVERWNGRSMDFQSAPRSPELDAAVRQRHPNLL